MLVSDDDMVNSNVGIFYGAPPRLLQRIFGSFRIDEQHAEHMNDVRKQFNPMNALLGDLPDVTRQECIY